MAPTKMLALFALLAVSWSAATATVFPLVIPTAAAAFAAINNPCAQYCMQQQPFATAGSPAFLLQPQQAFPIVTSPLFQQQQYALQCTAVSQMIQQQQQQISSQLAFISNPVAAATQFTCLSSPMVPAAMQQVPCLSNPMLATAIQSPFLFNPVAAVMQASYLSNSMAAATMQIPYPSNPITAAVQQSYAFNPFTTAGC